jgi:hypothetical protein
MGTQDDVKEDSRNSVNEATRFSRHDHQSHTEPLLWRRYYTNEGFWQEETQHASSPIAEKGVLEAQISTEPKNHFQPGTEVKLSATIKNVGTASNAPGSIQIRIDSTIDSSGSHNPFFKTRELTRTASYGSIRAEGTSTSTIQLETDA